MNHNQQDGFDGLRRRAEEQLDGRTQDGGELEASAPPLSELVHELEVHQVELDMQNKELLQSEHRLEASEKKYADLYNLAPVGYFTFDRKGTILEANLTGANLLGVDRQRLIGKPFTAYCTPESADLLYLHLGRVLKTQQPAKCELPLKRADGALFEAQLESVAAKDAQGAVSLCYAVLSDITERKQAEVEEARESGERGRTAADLDWVFDYSLDMLCMAGFDGYFKRVSPSFERILGWSETELLSKPVFDFIHPDDLESTRQMVQAHGGGKEAICFENRYRCKDGSYKWISWNSHPIIEEQRIIGVARDITERKRAEAAMQAHRQILETVTTNLPAGTALIRDSDLRILLANPAYQALVPGREMIGKTLEEAWPETHPAFGERCHQVVASGKPYSAMDELFMIRRSPDGPLEPAYFNWSLMPVRLPGEDDWGLLSVCQETTDSVQAREALRKNEERLRLAAMAGRIAWWDWHIPTGETIWNDEHYRMMGYQPGTVQPGYGAWADRMHPEDREATEAILRRSLDQGGDYYAQFRSLWPDGNVRWIEARGRVDRDSEGKPLRCYGVMLDTTERKEAEEALRTANAHLADADKRKDEFLAMLAHELRNPLAPVRNAVQVLRIAGPRDPVLMRQRDIIDRQVTHMARLLDDLLDVSRITRGKISLQKQQFHLTDVLVQAVETATPLIEARRHTLSLVLPQDDLRIEADPDRLAQVVGNLLTNAARYTPEGGRIWLEAACENSKEVVIRVRDTGMGIDPEVLPRIFDLFAQADQGLAHSQGGLGIGLTMVKRLVEMHGGSVEAHSAGLGQGSEFLVRLPALPEEPAQRPDAPGKLADQTGGTAVRRILVVDDVADSAESLAELLGLWGYETRTANDGMVALDVFHEFHPEVVVLDIGMPCIDGYEVARRLRRDFAGQPLLLIAMTGYAQESDRQLTQEAGFDHHLSKPVDLDALRDLLAHISE